jgi:hypothetical protein
MITFCSGVLSSSSKRPESCALAGSSERGLQATELIREGEELVSVPRQLAIVVADTEKCKYPDVIDPAFFKTCSRTEKLALVLLCEKSLGEASFVRSFSAASSDRLSEPV